MTFNQFCQLADRFVTLDDSAREAVRAMAAGDETAAAESAGGRGSEVWWRAEFFVKALADHGATAPPRFSPAARPPRTMALFTD